VRAVTRGSLLFALLCAVGLLVAASAQAQSVVANCDTPPSNRDTCNRWYSADSVILDWGWSPPAITTTGCGGATFAAERREALSCTVGWSDTTITKTVWVGIDRTAPRIVALQPDRPAGPTGWFNSPVGLTFRGADQTSGVASCSSTTYSGPDGFRVSIRGSCTDIAGNTGFGALPLNYDATAPPPPSVDVLPGNERVALEWSSPPGVEAEVVRSSKNGEPVVVFRGLGERLVDRRLRNGRRYGYTVSLIDQAGNRSSDRTGAVPTDSPLLLPAAGAHLKSAPELVWKRVRKARYYNVQLLRRGRKILSVWPRAHELELRESWRFGARRYRLKPAHYCWYVWPGLGARSERRYGKRLGKSCFTVMR
jgi:hypothetical protein